MPTANII